MNEKEISEKQQLVSAVYQFMNAVAKTAKINKVKDTVKIILYSRLGFIDTITFKHNDEFTNDFGFLARKKDCPGEYCVVLEDDPEKVMNCRLLTHDKENGIYFLMMKPETDEFNKGEKDDDTE